MRTCHIAIALLAGLVAAGCSVGPAGGPSSQGGPGVESGRPAARPFLTPLPGLAAQIANDRALREACRGDRGDRYGDRCGELLFYGAPGSTVPVIAPGFTAGLRNLRIAFVLTEISNTLVAGNGIGHDLQHLLFKFTAQATPEVTDRLQASVGRYIQPGASESFSFTVWKGLLKDGCVAPPPVIAIRFHNDISERPTGSDSYAEVGLFEAEDDTSLVPTGYWVFDYTVRATDKDGDASDFRIRGTVSVVCTNQNF